MNKPSTMAAMASALKATYDSWIWLNMHWLKGKLPENPIYFMGKAHGLLQIFPPKANPLNSRDVKHEKPP